MVLHLQIILQLLNELFEAIMVEALSHNKSLLLPSAPNESNISGLF